MCCIGTCIGSFGNIPDNGAKPNAGSVVSLSLINIVPTPPAWIFTPEADVNTTTVNCSCISLKESSEILI